MTVLNSWFFFLIWCSGDSDQRQADSREDDGDDENDEDDKPHFVIGGEWNEMIAR